MALAIYLKSDSPPTGFSSSYTLTSDVAYRVIANNLPELEWEHEGEALNEVRAGDITLACENATGWWTTWAAALNHSDRHPTAWYIQVYKEGKLRWEGDIDYKSIAFDTKQLTCTFTVLGILSRLERYSAEDVKRALPTHFDTGYGTAAASVVTDVSKNWETNALANHVFIDDTDACFTIASNTATAITVSSGSPSTGFYRVRPYVFKLSVVGTELTCADGDVSSADDEVTLTAHGLDGGEAVEYHASAGNIIGGLENYRTYWVIKVDANIIQLANTLADVATSTAINLTAVASGDTHYFIANAAAFALRAPSGCPTSTVELLDSGDTIRITRQGALPYRTVASKPGIVYVRTVYPHWEFDFEDVVAMHVGPRANTEPPQVTIASGQLTIDQEYDEVLGINDGYLVTTPFYRNTPVEDLARKLFVSAGLKENEDFIIAVPRSYASVSIPYADFTGKNVAEALVELAALSGCVLYSTGTLIIFAGRDLDRPGAQPKTISSAIIMEDSIQPAWEHGYDYVAVKDGEDREVRRGRYLTTGNGLEVETDYALRYPHMRALAQRYMGLFGGRRKYREITFAANGAATADTDRGLFVGTSGEAPVDWTAYTTAGAGGAIWTTDVNNYLLGAPDDGDKLYMLAYDNLGPQRNVDIYCDVELPNIANVWVGILACVPNYDTPSGWMLKVAKKASSAVTIEEFTGTGTTTVRATDTGAAISNGTWYRCRFRVQGYEIKAKVWEKAASEPEDWDVEYTTANKPSTGYCGVCCYEDDAAGYYYFDNFLAVGALDFQIGYNVGDRIIIDSEEWWVLGVREPIRALTYDDTITLQLASAVAYDVPRTWLKLNGSTAYARIGHFIETTQAQFDPTNDEIDAGGHGFVTGMPVSCILLSGTIYTGLTDGTIYYAIRMNDDTFALATTYANALAGTKVALTTGATGDYGFYEIIGNPSGSFTLMFHLRMDLGVWSSGKIIIANRYDGGAFGIAVETRGTAALDEYLRVYVGGLTFTGAVGYFDSEYITSADIISGIHVAIVVDMTAQTGMVWIDGNSSAAPTAITAGSISASARPLTIGNWSDLTTDWLQGSIRDVVMFDTALYQTEAARTAAVAAGTIEKTYPSSIERYKDVRPKGNEPWLRYFFPCEDGFGAVIRDRSEYDHYAYGFDNTWELPSNDASATAAKPEPPTILYYFGLFAPGSEDEVVVDTNLPTDRLFGFYFRVWGAASSPMSPDHEGFIPLGADAYPFYHGWPYTGGTLVVPGRFIVVLPETYSGYNIDMSVVSFDGHMSEPSDPYIVRNSHPAS